jgi:hypothetical protein
MAPPHARRMYLLLALDAKTRDEDGLWFNLRGRQQEFSGTPLATTLPGYDRLIKAGYTCTEDVVGALADELIKVAGLNRREADAVIAALAT